MKYTILLTLGLLATSFSAIAQTTYRWVDSNGQVHYSSNPPAASGENKPKHEEVRKETTATLAERVRAKEKAKQEVQQEQVQEAKDEKRKLDETQAAYDEEARQQAAQYAAQLKVACDGMRKDLAIYTNNPHAKVNVDGVIRRLTSDELSSRITDLQAKIKDNCQN